MAPKELTPDLEELAKQINEDPKRRNKDLEAIREWLKKQPHLKARNDDDFLLAFLRGCKFSLERTKEKLDLYYTYKTLLPEFFHDRDPMKPELQELLSVGTTAVLPKPDPKGREILLIRTGITNMKKHKVMDMMRLNFINMDACLLNDPRTVIAGSVVILDFKGSTLEHVTAMSPALMKKTMAVYQDGYPIRPQAIHYINTNAFFEKSFAMVKMFMKPKLRDRLFVHGSNLEKLYEHIPRDLLPSDYGGTLAPIDELAAQWKAKIESYRNWFLEDTKYGSDEKKRIGKPKTSSDVFGIEGSFRTLDLD